MKIPKRLKQTFVALSTSLLITGIVPCIPAAITNYPVTVEAATKVKISKTKITLNKGQVVTLKLTGTKEKVTWRSSDKKVAIVNSKGKVTAKANGTATITATVSGKRYTCRVTVKNANVPVEKVPSCAAKQTVYATGFNGPRIINIRYRSLELPNSFIYIKNLDANAKITDIKSSNPQIKTFTRNDINAIGIDSNTSENLLGISSLISFKVTQNGKSYNLSCEINIEKQESIVSSFKIGSQNITKYCEGANTLTGLKLNKKQLVSIKMKPDYIFDYYQVLYNKNGKYESIKFKNNSYIDFTNCTSFQVMYHTTKKPINYSESPNWWGGIVPTPLHNYFRIDFPQSSM